MTRRPFSLRPGKPPKIEPPCGMFRGQTTSGLFLFYPSGFMNPGLILPRTKRPQVSERQVVDARMPYLQTGG
jgi:hypothetical protein